MFQGEFKNGQITGQGKKEFLKENKILEGEFLENNFIGDTIVFSNYEYKGEIYANKANGIGRLSFENNNYFEGTFLNDEIFENQ